MDNPKFKMFRGRDEQFYFSLRLENGEPILAGEGYVAKRGCENGIAAVKVNAPLDERYERKTSTDGQSYFVLKAANGEPIGRSETYTAESSRENGIRAVKRVAPGAPIEDTT